MKNSQKKQTIKKENRLYKEFILSLKTLNTILPQVYTIFVIFILITLIGLLFPYFAKDRILAILKRIALQTKDLNYPELFSFIVSNNIRASFTAFISGIFLAVIPSSILILNAYILGFVMNLAIKEAGTLIIWRLLPHGIFELPALLISITMGITLGISIMRNCIKTYIPNANELTMNILILLSVFFMPITVWIYFVLTLFKSRLRKDASLLVFNYLKVFILVVIPLLVIAGIIESSLILLLK